MTDNDNATADAAVSRLCLACGMCCNGVMFHLVRLQPADSPKALAALGMKLKHKKGQHHFTQPCAFLKNTCCTIYAQRPERCRLFECRQIGGLRGGTIREAEAAERIREVRERVNRVEELLAQCGNVKVKQPLSERYARVMAEPEEMGGGPEFGDIKNRLHQEMQELNKILNFEFRMEPIPLPENSF